MPLTKGHSHLRIESWLLFLLLFKGNALYFQIDYILLPYLPTYYLYSSQSTNVGRFQRKKTIKKRTFFL